MKTILKNQNFDEQAFWQVSELDKKTFWQSHE